LYWYASRWYSASLGRFVSPDTIIPQPGNPQAWDRYSYVNSNPVRYTDPSGHKACEWDENGNCIRDPDWQPGIDKSIVSNTEILLSFDSKAIAEKAIPFSTEELRNWAMNLDHVALGIDSFAELIVLGFVVVGMIGGTTFEGNPVTGIPSGSGAGWIIGETNPVVQGLVTAGNISATLASTSSILGDLKAGDSRLQLQVSQATNTISLNGNVSISSSSLASGYLTTLGWAVRVVEGSLLVQGIAVAFDHGVVPTRNFSFSFNLQLPKR